jgi:hypothetical protein
MNLSSAACKISGTSAVPGAGQERRLRDWLACCSKRLKTSHLGVCMRIALVGASIGWTAVGDCYTAASSGLRQSVQDEHNPLEHLVLYFPHFWKCCS